MDWRDQAEGLRPNDHYFRGFDQGGHRLALFQSHFADCVGRDS
jgi:hypothetical protein